MTPDGVGKLRQIHGEDEKQVGDETHQLAVALP